MRRATDWSSVLWSLLLAAVFGALGCATGTKPGNRSDTGTVADSGPLDSGSGQWTEAGTDARPSAPDATAKDATAPDAAVARACLHIPSADAGSVQPALASFTPTVKWIKKLSDYGGGGYKGLVMSKEAVAVVVANGLLVMNKASSQVNGFFKFGGQLFEDVTVTKNGSFLIASAEAYAIDRDANLVWSLRLTGQPIMNESSVCRLSYSEQRGLAIAMCNDGWMYGIREAGPEIAWKAPLYSQGNFSVYPSPSAGDIASIFVGESARPAGTWAVDPASGQTLGAVTTPDVAIGLFSRQGFIARKNSTSAVVLLDECGEERWNTSVSDGYQTPLIVGFPDDRVFAGELVADGKLQLGMFALADGRRLAGPTGSGMPLAAGADGTFYALTCALGPVTQYTPEPPFLVALTENLEEKWRVMLPVPAEHGMFPCPRPAVALDEDGVMYLAVEAGGTHMLAVQTQSPGIASTPWPLWFRSHNGSLWAD